MLGAWRSEFLLEGPVLLTMDEDAFVGSIAITVVAAGGD
jgi:hypothetical protein